MKLWLAKNSEVSVHDQIVTQMILAVTGGDLKIGDKLPSTRELARRHDIHPNTVAAAYRSLLETNLIGFRKGSGYYVSDDQLKSKTLEMLVTEFLDSTMRAGFSEKEIYDCIDKRKKHNPAGRVLLVESDLGLRDILVHEIGEALDTEIRSVSFEDFKNEAVAEGAVLTAMFDEKPKIDPLLAYGRRCYYLSGRSVSSAMAGETRPGANQSIAVVSGWDGFLTLARVMLLAARIEPGNLIIRSTKDEEWQSAIAQASIVICDSLTALSLNGLTNIRTFPLVSEESLDVLRKSVQ